ncbi:DUF4258 domain-containing protein [Sulfobacillus sp. DSM 109850]|uniref:DUF4258 domain-containing protein n=2 Tax=Sulfobacillus harzensis TaxID=2729629 RepID=A0A7Y0Q3I7_9FIRM|nr:DUF4258 domain-containing protein [Sulfobacillus harzensis]
MFERQIERSVVESVIQSGTTIESYPEDTPYPSRLVLGWDRPVHVVVAETALTSFCSTPPRDIES